MEKKNEVVLQNTVIENVFRYLLDYLRELNGIQMERTGADGTIYGYCIQTVFPSNLNMSSNYNKIDVKYTTSVVPQGNLEKAYGCWGSFIAMSFEARQLQTDTVQVKGECQQSFIVTKFDDCWATMLKAFGMTRPPDTPIREIADSAAGTISISGALNEGYGVVVVPTKRIDIPFANFEVKDAGQHGSAQIQEPPKPPEPKESGGKITLWLDWYHAMLDKGYKCTLEEVASKSGYSVGYIKQKHMIYQAKPNQTPNQK